GSSSFLTVEPPPPPATLFPYTTLFRSLPRIRAVTVCRTRVPQSASRPMEYVARRSGRRAARLDSLRGNRLCHSTPGAALRPCSRSEEHTSELHSRENIVCRLLLATQQV